MTQKKGMATVYDAICRNLSNVLIHKVYYLVVRAAGAGRVVGRLLAVPGAASSSGLHGFGKELS